MRRRTRTRTRCSLLLSFVALLGSGSSRWGNDSRGNVWGVGPRLGDACGIAGYDSGECVDYNPEFYEPRLSFCKGSVKYRACLPKANDNFPNHSISMKDDWVRDTFDEIVAERIAAEQNTNYLQNQVNEYGDPGVVVQRFSDPNVGGALACSCCLPDLLSSCSRSQCLDIFVVCFSGLRGNLLPPFLLHARVSRGTSKTARMRCKRTCVS